MNSVFALTSPDELQTRADHGEAESQYRFAKKIFYQDGTNLDRANAAKYFKMAADQNHPKGQNGYGACLEFGIGVEADMKEAAKYYAMSASQGDPIGQMNYGICLLNGYGIPKYTPPEKEKTTTIDMDEIEEENRLSPQMIAQFAKLNGGIDISQIDPKNSSNSNNKSKFPLPQPITDSTENDCSLNQESTQHLHSSANQHSSQQLSHQQQQQQQQQQKRTRQTIPLHNQQSSGAAIISSSSSSRLHHSQLSGNESTKDKDKAKKNLPKIAPPSDYFRYSAESGDIAGQSIYGRCLLRGLNVETDFKEAERYLQLAADAGDTDAKRCFMYYSTINEREFARKLPLNRTTGKRGVRARSVLQSVIKR